MSKISKNIYTNSGFGDYIWNHRDKCIQMSTNMSGIRSSIREIDVKISENFRKETGFFCSVKPVPAF